MEDRMDDGRGVLGRTVAAVALTGGVLAAGGALIVATHRPAAPVARLAPPRPKPVAARAVAKPAVRVPAPKAGAEAEAGYVVKRVLKIEGVMRTGDYVWDDDGVPAGPLVMTVDLAARTMSVFRAGYEIGAAAILYGADDKPTPLGVFPIIEKDADHVSNLYDAPMPYMLRLTGDGVAIHANATMAADSATHGCIGVPTKFAALLFRQARIGDRVIITNGEMLKAGQAITAA